MAAHSPEAVVRQYMEPFCGIDFVPPVEQVLGRRAELGDQAAVASIGPAWQVIAPEIRFDVTPVLGESALKTVFDGYGELLDFWADWLETWDEYVYDVAGYENSRDWVVADVGVRARSRAGIPIDFRVAQAFQVREGRIVSVRVFRAMADARDLPRS